MYDSLLIANYIIQRCNDIGAMISNLKLQKLLYFVQAEFLVDIGEPCFSEKIEAWSFGPVIPSVYRKYRIYGGAQIPAGTVEILGFISQEDKERIYRIVDICAHFSSAYLTDMTLIQAPWINAYSRLRRNEITCESIKSYFEEG